jgi:hypothetical protein
MNAFVIALIVTVGGGIVIQALVHLWAACGLDAVVSLEEAWVRFYTAGLPEAVRDRRRDELKSHLYELQDHARAAGYTPKEIAVQLALGWLRGIPADLSWRLGSIHLATPLGAWLLALLDRLVAFVECWLPNMLSREYGLILLVGLPIQVALRAWGHYPAALARSSIRTTTFRPGA